MKIATLVRIEFIKTVRRRAFWVTLVFMALVSSMVIIGTFVQGRRGDGAPFVAPYSWAMAGGALNVMPAFFLALALVMLVTSEFSWRTARQNVIDGLSREQFFAAKLLMMLLVMAAFLVVPFTIATGTAAYGRVFGATPAEVSTSTADSTARSSAAAGPVSIGASASGRARVPMDSAQAAAMRRVDSAQAALREAVRDLRQSRRSIQYPAPDPHAPLLSLDDLKVFAGFALGTLGFASMALMLAMILRSTGGAIGVFFLWFAFLEQLVLLMIRRFGSTETADAVAPYLPVGALRAPLEPRIWHHAFVERANAIAASMGQALPPLDVDMRKVIGLPLAWTAVFVGVAFLAFRRRDL
jgi:ABC-2 family transporter protein